MKENEKLAVDFVINRDNRAAAVSSKQAPHHWIARGLAIQMDSAILDFSQMTSGSEFAEDISVGDPVQIGANRPFNIFGEEPYGTIPEHDVQATHMLTAGPAPVTEAGCMINPSTPSVVWGRGTELQANLNPTTRAPIGVLSIGAAFLTSFGHHRSVRKAVGHVAKSAETAIFKHHPRVSCTGRPSIAGKVQSDGYEIVVRALRPVPTGMVIGRRKRTDAVVGRTVKDRRSPGNQGTVDGCAVATSQGHSIRSSGHVIIECSVEIELIVQRSLIQERQQQHQAIQVHRHGGRRSRRCRATPACDLPRGEDVVRLMVVVQREAELL